MNHRIPTLFCLVFAVYVNTIITVHAQAVNKQDSLALVDLYKSTNGSNWGDHANWLTRKSVKTWYGITVTGTRVTKIELFLNNLNGNIPATISNLVKLSELDIGTSEDNIGNHMRGR